MKTKNLVLIMSLIIMSFMLIGCDGSGVVDDIQNNDFASGDVSKTNSGDSVETDGIIKIELYPQIAPESVENFIALANSGFYNGLTFHRTIPGFMAQGGDPDGNGTGGPGYGIYGEFSLNGFENSLKHERGVLSMARSDENNSAGSQFFIMVEAAEHLDGSYAAFGKVIDGMDVVDEIVNTKVVRRELDSDIIERLMSGTNIDEKLIEEYYMQQMELDRPVNPPVIKSISVETFGIAYGDVAKLTGDVSGDMELIAGKDANRYADITQNPIVTIEIEK